MIISIYILGRYKFLLLQPSQNVLEEEVRVMLEAARVPLAPEQVSVGREPLGGSGGTPSPGKFLKFRCSEMQSERDLSAKILFNSHQFNTATFAIKCQKR